MPPSLSTLQPDLLQGRRLTEGMILFFSVHSLITLGDETVCKVRRANEAERVELAMGKGLHAAHFPFTWMLGLVKVRAE